MKVNSLNFNNSNSNTQSFGHCMLFRDSASNKLKFLVTSKNPANDSLVSFFDGKDFYKLGESEEASKLTKKLRIMHNNIANNNRTEGDVRELLSDIIDKVIKFKLFCQLGSSEGPTLRTFIGDSPLKEMNKIANFGDITCAPAHAKDGKLTNEVNALFIG